LFKALFVVVRSAEIPAGELDAQQNGHFLRHGARPEEISIVLLIFIDGVPTGRSVECES
jgi:hypothetical protein